MSKSDLRTLLDNLNQLVRCYQNLSSQKAREALLMAFGVEVSLVTLKLKAMRKRWQLFLPFQEAINVNFQKELQVATSWLPVLGEEVEGTKNEYVRLELENDYLLDLMDVQLEPIRSGLSTDELKQAVVDYCKKVDKLLKKSDLTDWEEVAMNRLELNVRELVAKMDRKDAIREVCIQAVHALADVLQELEDFFWSDLKEEQFLVLAVRLMYRDCQDAIQRAHHQVRKEHNSWPKKFEKDRAIAMKERVKERLMKEARGEELKEYIDLDYPALLDDACFGQYLFKARHELTTEEVQLMVHCCTMIEDLNKFIDPNLSIKKRKAQALGRELNAEEKAILKSLLELVEIAEWRSGATADSISLGINRMLGVGYHLDSNMQLLSDVLWKMLKKRKQCDGEKSLKVTWLNIVGWCVNHKYLIGTSPTLCSQFFPQCEKDDYKAIDKGKAGEPVVFKKIEPLLDKFMK